ncbi:MAG: class I SAM-dependent methyltransferase [Steroidobacter sp.]
MNWYEDHVLPHLINLSMRNRHLAPYRRRVISGAKGRVLEVGLGSGLNLPFYASEVTEILGLEPSPRLITMAEAIAGRRSPIPTRMIKGSAEAIPLEDRSVDTVVTTWTLCTIPHPLAALREMKRVLKPTGQLLFVEHGQAPEERIRKWQDRLTPAWKRIGGGCHLNRPIPALIHEAGFSIAQLETGYMKGPKPMTFMYEGRACP